MMFKVFSLPFYARFSEPKIARLMPRTAGTNAAPVIRIVNILFISLCFVYTQIIEKMMFKKQVVFILRFP